MRRSTKAADRRLEDELHTRADLEFAYKFVYRAAFGDLGSEHEFCHVLLGAIGDPPVPNHTEIAALKYLSPADLEQEFATNGDAYTPWFRMEWQRLTEEFADTLAKYTR